MNAIQNLEYCQRVLEFLYKLLFRDLQNDRNRWINKIITYSLILLVINYIYTIGFYEKDPFNILSASGYFSSVTQVYVLHVVMSDIIKLGDVVRAIEPYFVANSKPTQRDFALCNRFAKSMKIVSQATIGAYVTLSLIVSVSLQIGGYLSGNMRPSLLVYFVGIREYSTGLMILLHLYNYIMALLALALVTTTDMLVSLACFSITFISLRFEAEVTAFNEDLEKGRLTPEEMTQKLKDIILMHREYDENFNKLDSGFRVTCITKYATGCGIMLIGLYEFIKHRDAFGGSFMAGGCFEIGAYCALGAIIEMASDRTCDSVQRIKWYLLPLNEQLKYLRLLHFAQQPRTLLIGGIKPLNMETYVSTTKAVYSWAMVLYRSG